jgi:hypothetical protein
MCHNESHVSQVLRKTLSGQKGGNDTLSGLLSHGRGLFGVVETRAGLFVGKKGRSCKTQFLLDIRSSAEEDCLVGSDKRVDARPTETNRGHFPSTGIGVSFYRWRGVKSKRLYIFSTMECQITVVFLAFRSRFPQLESGCAVVRTKVEQSSRYTDFDSVKS